MSDQEEAFRDHLCKALGRELVMRSALQKADDAISKYLSHQLSHQESYVILRSARDGVRAALTTASVQAKEKKA